MGFTGAKAAAFKEAYINAFNAMEQRLRDEDSRMLDRSVARLEHPEMTKALKDSRANQGKETKSHHYANEANLINRLVLGTTAKKYCEDNNIPRADLRDHIPPAAVKLIMKAQNRNTVMIELGMTYSERKDKLKSIFHDDLMKVLASLGDSELPTTLPIK